MDDVAGPGIPAIDGDRYLLLLEVLGEGRRRGFVGPGDPAVMLAHAAGFGEGLEAPDSLVDLGSGNGLPGLVLAEMWPETGIVLLDGSRSRVDFLDWARLLLGHRDRVRTVALRAEVAGREEDLRGGFEMVAARGFGPPAVTAECAAPFLRPRGVVVVSEPPGESAGRADDRWPAGRLEILGLELSRHRAVPYHYQELVAVTSCPNAYPRRIGVPAKRPLF